MSANLGFTGVRILGQLLVVICDRNIRERFAQLPFHAVRNKWYMPLFPVPVQR